MTDPNTVMSRIVLRDEINGRILCINDPMKLRVILEFINGVNRDEATDRDSDDTDDSSIVPGV